MTRFHLMRPFIVALVGLSAACNLNLGAEGGEGEGEGEEGEGEGSPFVYEDAVEACVKLSSCGINDGLRVSRINQSTAVSGLFTLCVTSFLDTLANGRTGDVAFAYGHVARCAGTTDTCEEFHDCISYDLDYTNCQRGCRGDLHIIECPTSALDLWRGNVRDCSDHGMGCAPGSNSDEATCATGTPCVSGELACDGSGALLSCDWLGRQQRTVCADGYACTDPYVGACVPSGPLCQPAGLNGCDAEGNATQCVSTPTGESRILFNQCATQHMECDLNVDQCVPASFTCLANEQAYCNEAGTGWTGCANGVPIDVDCARFGRTTCVMDPYPTCR